MTVVSQILYKMIPACRRAEYLQCKNETFFWCFSHQLLYFTFKKLNTIHNRNVWFSWWALRCCLTRSRCLLFLWRWYRSNWPRRTMNWCRAVIPDKLFNTFSRLMICPFPLLDGRCKMPFYNTHNGAKCMYLVVRNLRLLPNPNPRFLKSVLKFGLIKDSKAELIATEWDMGNPAIT